tara:strand:+ start:1043 stop:1234 length:192 start_codon:yes stop_codon:yes gene_type:complete
MQIAYILIALATMLLGLVGMLPYVDTPLPMNEAWDFAQSMAAIFITLYAALLCIGGIMLAFCR